MHPAVRALMKACARQYDPRSFQSCGPLLLTQLRRAPFYARLVNFLSSFNILQGFFWRVEDVFFDPTMTEKVLEKVNGSYGVHLWNRFSKGTKAIIGSGQPAGTPSSDPLPISLQTSLNCGIPIKRLRKRLTIKGAWALLH
ncbi:hypothetical protein MRX96_041591 [Rhipicephalus microplus]